MKKSKSVAPAMKTTVSTNNKVADKDYVKIADRYIAFLDKLIFLLDKFESDPRAIKNNADYIKLQSIKLNVLKLNYSL